MSQRLETLKSLAAQDPTNIRIQYMLAMELAATGDVDGAVAQFRSIIERDPGYVTAYFQEGQTFEKAGRTEEAREAYRRGIAAAARAGDRHAETEMQAALDLLG